MSNIAESAIATTTKADGGARTAYAEAHAIQSAVADCWTKPNRTQSAPAFQSSAQPARASDSFRMASQPTGIFDSFQIYDGAKSLYLGIEMNTDLRNSVERNSDLRRVPGNSERFEMTRQPVDTGTTNASLEHAASQIAQQARLRWGASNVHLNEKDPVEAAAVLMLGPKVYELIGPETACALTRETLVFAFGSAYGAEREFHERNVQCLFNRAVSNVATGLGMAGLSEALPHAGIAVGAGMATGWLVHELGPDSAERNGKLSAIAHELWNDKTNSRLQSGTSEVSKLLGRDVFETSFDTATGALGFEARRMGGSTTAGDMGVGNAVTENLRQRFDSLMQRMDETLKQYQPEPIRHSFLNSSRSPEATPATPKFDVDLIRAHIMKWVNACTPIDALKILPETVRNHKSEQFVASLCETMEPAEVAECVRTIFQPMGTASEEHIRAVVTALSELPLPDLQTLLEGKCKVYAPKNVANFDPVLARQPYVKGFDSNHSSAMTFRKRTVIPEFHRGADSTTATVRSESVLQDTTHEIGHLLEQEREWFSGPLHNAFQLDCSTVAERLPRTARFLAPGHLGPSSCFEVTAEMYAISLEKSILARNRIKLLLKAYPKTWEYLNDSDWGRKHVEE